MPRGPSAVAIQLSEEARAEIEAMTRSRTLPNPLVRRAQMVLLAADGKPNGQIGEMTGLSRATVIKWRRRYAKQGLVGLYDEPRPGGPRSIEDDRIVALIRKTIRTKPKDRTHWSCRAIASQIGLSKSTVQRVWRAFGLQPHRQ